MPDWSAAPTGDLTDLVSEFPELVDPPAWHADAACRDHPEINWFPRRGEDVSPARAMCAGCLVRAECLAAAGPDVAGIWGGTSAKERRRLRTGDERVAN